MSNNQPIFVQMRASYEYPGCGKGNFTITGSNAGVVGWWFYSGTSGGWECPVCGLLNHQENQTCAAQGWVKKPEDN